MKQKYCDELIRSRDDTANCLDNKARRALVQPVEHKRALFMEFIHSESLVPYNKAY